jgi:tetratricopeptide (TPR) repeat protein
MKYLSWLLKAAIFFTLFAFALNNQQDATVHFFFGTAWTAPLVLVVLAAFAAASSSARWAWSALVEAAQGGAPHAGLRKATAPSSARARPRRMDFDLTWLLWGLPVAFGLAGWHRASTCGSCASRTGSRPRPTSAGLNFLLNEQQDQAIDAFIEAVQNDPDTSELHFALGNLFRRRGEYERAVRVHEHLLSRADLSREDRHRAQHALALDYLKPACSIAPRRRCASSKARPTRSRRCWPCWRSTSVRATGCRPRRSRASSTPVPPASSPAGQAHYLCEQAQAAPPAQAEQLLQQALKAAPTRRARGWNWPRCGARAGDARGAFALLVETAGAVPSALPLLAGPWWTRRTPAMRRRRRARSCNPAYEQSSSLDVLDGITSLVRDPEAARSWYVQHLQREPSLGRGRQVDRRREAGARTVPSRRATRTGPGREAPHPLPLRRLRLRGQAAFLAMPRLPGLGQLPGRAGSKSYDPPPKRPAAASPSRGRRQRPGKAGSAVVLEEARHPMNPSKQRIARPACWSSATPCWTATGTAPWSAFPPRRRCPW